MNNRYGRKAAAVMLALLCTTTAMGHIKNEATQFPDIEFSDARFDIVMLVGAGIIPQTPVFEPDKPLSMAELATWTALARGLGSGGETPNTTTLAKAVVDAGLVDNLDRDASYADINALLFDGALDLETPAATPTKAEAASFIAGFVGTPAGEGLLGGRDIAIGETGEVSSATTPEGRRGYVITIADVTRPMDAHGRVANGPTDLLQWEGRYVVRSFVIGSGENAMWTYIEAGERPAAPAPATTPGDASSETADLSATGDTGPAAEQPSSPDAGMDGGGGNKLLLYLVVAVIVLGGLLFIQGRRKG